MCFQYHGAIYDTSLASPDVSASAHCMPQCKAAACIRSDTAHCQALLDTSCQVRDSSRVAVDTG